MGRLKGNHEKGQSLLELAVGLVVLLILVAGIIDLGRLLFYYISLRDAAQEGAVYGQLNPKSCDQIIERVKSYLGNSGGEVITVSEKIIDPSAVPEPAYVSCATAAANPSISCTGNEIQVEITAPFSFVTPIFGRELTLKTDITGTILRPTCSP